MTTRQLTVHNASVTTMTVEVKTLTIGTRQVTQGIFRQLIEEPLIAEDGTLNGVPWGHVTWHPDRCDGHRTEHWHIVWQSGAELRRAWVGTKPDFPADFTGPAANWFLTAWVREACHGRANEAVIADVERDGTRELTEPVNAEMRVRAWARMSEKACEAAARDRWVPVALKQVTKPLTAFELSHSTRSGDWRFTHAELAVTLKRAIESDVQVSLNRGPDGDFEAQIIESHDAVGLGNALRAEEGAVLELLTLMRGEELGALVAAMEERSAAVAALDAEVDGWGLTWPEIKAQYESVIRAEAARRQRHRDVRATLAQLPQLFIGG